MSDKCGYCKQHKATNHLVLNGGNLWIEFCEDCGKKETLQNTKGDKLTVQQVYDNSNSKTNKIT